MSFSFGKCHAKNDQILKIATFLTKSAYKCPLKWGFEGDFCLSTQRCGQIWDQYLSFSLPISGYFFAYIPLFLLFSPHPINVSIFSCCFSELFQQAASLFPIFVHTFFNRNLDLSTFIHIFCGHKRKERNIVV